MSEHWEHHWMMVPVIGTVTGYQLQWGEGVCVAHYYYDCHSQCVVDHK